MARHFWILAIGLGLALATGCAESTMPSDLLALTDDYELPAPDTSLAPDRLSVGNYIATPCALHQPGGFDHLRERHEWALVDVYFGRGSADGPWGKPAAADVELVTSHGGRVLHEFNIPAVRARMILSRVPGLVADGFWIVVRDVPDATRYDVPLGVGFTRPLSDADVELFESLGGRVTHRFDFIDALHGILPDRSIPEFQRRSDVAYVQDESVYCLGS